MIKKKGKGNLVEDLKMINPIKVDFNYANKVITKEILRCTEENNLLLIE